ncbi:YARHG domain protein [Lachnoanaerobaculum sp. MSX33]|uniref:YARHG domain-containing protein n=1 Tax=Lachnoanaerobaculum sp. MSX33 TaxID=936596 RepID=UPI0003DFA1AA|nr:YARHG domain-containing protein [Lachnoanaerobaculum sp. MSX33]ETO97071.1 YARHG domain protein [Lachnoanaerobaculum sp. MSX33]
MFCSKCGKQVRDGMNYCTNCGEPVKKDEGGVNLKKDDDKVSSEAALPHGNVSGKSNKAKKTKKNKGVKIVFITIAGIILALLLILFALIQTGIISISIDDSTNQESVLDKKSKSSKREKEKERRAKEKESEEGDVTTQAQTEPVSTEAQTVQPATMPSTVAINNEFILPDSSVRVLDKSELAGLGAEQCRLARNEIYAKHGRMFDDAGLQNYFNSRSWYHGTIPAKQFNDNMLSDIEIQNRNLIIAFEKEMGYTK